MLSNRIFRCLLISVFLASVITFVIVPWYSKTFVYGQSTNATITILNPSGAPDDKIADSSEYSTLVLGDPWDMNQITDLKQDSTSHCSTCRPFFSNVSVLNGIWTGTSNVNPGENAFVWLLFPGYKGTLHTGKVGSLFPIDTSKYYKLTFRMYLSEVHKPPSDPQPWDNIYLYWTDGDVGDFYNGRCELSNPITSVAGWNTYEVDLRTIGTQTGGLCKNRLGGWTGKVTGLRMDPIFTNGVIVKFDWIRLTGDAEKANNFTVEWTANGGSDALVNLYLDDNTNAADGFLYTLGKNIPASAGSFPWTARTMAPGRYYVYSVMSSDYAAMTMSDPWDMKQSTDVVDSYGINTTYNSGILNGTTTVAGGFLAFKIDSTNLIDPSIYDKLIFRQYTANVGQTYTIAWQDSDWSWVWYGVNVTLLQGWSTYKLDLSNNSAWKNGKMKISLRLLPVTQPYSSFQLDWVGLTGGSEPVSEADLGPFTDYSSGTMTINTPSIVQISRPSMTSGVDYATEALGNPWDMNDASDVAAFGNVIEQNFTNGILNGKYKQSPEAAAQKCGDPGPWGDPQVLLKMGEKVDSTRFRYLTFKVMLDGTQDVGWGWSSRIIFYEKGYHSPTFPQGDDATTNDLILEEGWNTITIDLGDNSRTWPNGLYDDQGTSYSTWTTISPAMIRFDPHEIPNSLPLTFHIDDIKLTAKDTADSSYFVQWAVTNPDNNTLTTKLYYSTVAGGGTDILIGTVPVGATSYTWNTFGVTEGEYYIKVEVYDGYNTTSWYSHSPLVVAHTGHAVLSVTPGTLILMAEFRGGHSTIGKLIVDNLGLIPMNWTITAPNWLKVNPSSGVDGPTEVSVTPNIGGLAKGTYTGEIMVDGGIAGIQTIQVTLVIVDNLFNSFFPLMIR